MIPHRTAIIHEMSTPDSSLVHLNTVIIQNSSDIEIILCPSRRIVRLQFGEPRATTVLCLFRAVNRCHWLVRLQTVKQSELICSSQLSSSLAISFSIKSYCTYYFLQTYVFSLCTHSRKDDHDPHDTPLQYP